MNLKAIGFVFGTAFGFVLAWARVTDYDVIHDMLLLRHPDMFLLMTSAMLTAAVGIRLLRAFHARAILDGTPVTWNTQPPRRRHLIGSTCPGPVAAQLGRGQVACLFTIAGMLAGILICDLIVRARRETRAARGPMTEPVSVAGL